MTDFPFDAIGFDLDGTLLDTAPDLGAAVNHALKEGGFREVSLKDSKGLIGGGAKLMLKRAVEAQGGLDDAAFHALYKVMLGYYEQHCAVLTKPYPGVEQALQELGEMGVIMAVVTNKFEGFARSIISQLGLTHHFITIIGGDTMGKGKAKPAPDPIYEAIKRCEAKSFAFLGDSSFDVGAARAASVPVIVAAYGYLDKPAKELGGDAIIESFDALIPALRALGRQ